MAHLEVYQRHQLAPDSKQIRVPDVLPVPDTTPDQDAEPIQCNIRIIDLDASPLFTTLSYVWGIDPPNSAHPIVCEDLQIPLTTNCHSALRHLRKKLGKLTIWVDAVCINQIDLAEKQQQVPLMGIFIVLLSWYIYGSEKGHRERIEPCGISRQTVWTNTSQSQGPLLPHGFCCLHPGTGSNVLYQYEVWDSMTAFQLLV